MSEDTSVSVWVVVAIAVAAVALLMVPAWYFLDKVMGADTAVSEDAGSSSATSTPTTLLPVVTSTSGPVSSSTTEEAATDTRTVGMMTIVANTVLTRDHNGRIVISADNVVLDCAGHTVVGPGRRAGLPGIWMVRRTGVTVKNCVLTDFNDGFRVQESNTNTFLNNSVSTVRQGFTLQNSDNNTLTGNSVSDANDFFGISLGSSHGNTLTSNTVLDSEHGFIFSNSDNNILTGNTALRNMFGVGGRLGGVGFIISNSDNNVIANNVSNENLTGFTVGTDSTANDLSQNRASNNDNEGFFVFEAYDNIFTNNHASGNGYGFFIPRVPNNSGNSLIGNTVNNNTEWGIFDDTIGGTGDAGTDNHYSNNSCSGNGAGGSFPAGLC